MTVFQAIVLGVLQGLAEFLPISSSAHLTLAPWLFGWPDPGLAFDVALHVGTLAAVLWYYWAEWLKLLRALGRVLVRRRVETVEERRLGFLVLATIPGAVGGLVLEDYAEHTFRAPIIVAIALIALGVILWAVDRWAARGRALDQMRWTDALVIGLAQVLALVPGVSRSGSTMTAGRALGFSREHAAAFSFLMSMPITAAAALFKVPEAVRQYGIDAPMIAGVVASAVSGWLAIAVLLRFLSKHSFGVFAVYRVLLGLVVIWQISARA